MYYNERSSSILKKKINKIKFESGTCFCLLTCFFLCFETTISTQFQAGGNAIILILACSFKSSFCLFCFWFWSFRHIFINHWCYTNASSAGVTSNMKKKASIKNLNKEFNFRRMEKYFNYVFRFLLNLGVESLLLKTYISWEDFSIHSVFIL